MNNTIKITLSVSVLLFSCNNEENRKGMSKEKQELQNINETMPLTEFVSWTAASENELTKNKEFNEINYRLSFMPAQSLAYIELKGQKFNDDQLKEASKHYTGMTYFNLRIETPKSSGELLKYDLSSGQQYNERINYMAFKMQKDIFLVQGNDTLFPGMFHYERIFEVAPYATVMLAFDDARFDREKEFTIVYDDHLFNKGYIKYTYPSGQLIDLPQISGV